jgi:3-deoxy-D-manno-octulosonate 8-phosphate phosphatase (KDO 8-P phosphatase)
MLGRAGIQTALITGRISKVVDLRAKELGITDVYQRVFKKSEVYEKLLQKYGCKDENIAFMGDDVVDQELLKRSGLTAVPRDAEEDVKEFADLVMTRNGGRGAVREFINFILKHSGLWKKVSGESLA